MHPTIIFQNGQYIPESDARLAVQDRGVLFADGVYEVVRYDRGRAFAMDAHLQRLARSLAGIELDGIDVDAFAGWSDELVRRNGLTDAKVYWQVTRGPASRDFVIPDVPTPSITLIATPMPAINRDTPLPVGEAIVVDDCRWTKCGIKSLMLLPASLAKTRAKRAGAVEAIFERVKPGAAGNHITEGASTNVLIVRGGKLQTHPDDGWVLNGITRRVVLQLAEQLRIAAVIEQPFTRPQLLAADEVLVCSTTQLTAITAVDGHPIANRQPGPITQKLHVAHLDAVLSGMHLE